MSSEQNRVAIGIDLGTCMSCVGVFQNGRVEIIPNDQGNRITPSIVSFSKDSSERLVGDSAKSAANGNPTGTLFDIKRIIGLPWDNPDLQKDIANFPFKVKNDGQNKPIIEVEFNGETKDYYPEAISAMILTKMKEIAESFIGKKVTDAVVTVPARFQNSSKESTKAACQIAGLNCLRIINEPTAAAIAYHLDKKKDKDQYVLVFDMGGGTHDVSLLEITTDGLIEVKATGGCVHLGGTDFDNRILSYCVDEFKKKHKQDISGNSKSMRRLLTACERAKKTLSSSQSTSIEVDSLFDGIDFNIQLTRAKFESICMDIFQRAIDPVSDVLRDAHLSKNQIDEIVLVGGSTRIPKVQDMLSQYFNGKELNKSVNPDEAVAYGAAVQASILIGDVHETTKDLLLLDVTPLSLSIETAGQISTVIVPRGTTIPVRKSETFSTFADNQPGCTIRIFEGERKFTKDNNLLGQFDLSGIPPAPRGVPKITVDLDIDANGILNVSAKEESSGKTNKVTITNDKNRLSQSDIEKMVKEAEKFKEQDELLKSKVEARNSMENYVYQIKNAMTGEMKDKFSEEDKTVLNSLVNDTLQWIESGDHSKEDYDVKQKEIESVYFPIIQKAYGGAGGAGGGMPPGFDPSMFTGGMPKDDQNASNSGSNIEELD